MREKERKTDRERMGCVSDESESTSRVDARLDLWRFTETEAADQTRRIYQLPKPVQTSVYV